MPHIIDLTRPLRDGERGVSYDTARTIEDDGWNAKTLHLYSHSGTHMDAPMHFLPGAPTLETLDLNQCVGPARKLDLRPIGDKALITADMLVRCATGDVRGLRLILQTGWESREGTDGFRDNLPRLSEDAAHWLVDHQVALVGVEPPSVADVHDLEEVTLIHQILLGAGVVIAEGLMNLDALPTDAPFTLIALPLKIEGGDGAPARIIALLNEQSPS